MRFAQCIAPQGLRGGIGHLREKDLIFGYIPHLAERDYGADRLVRRPILFSPRSPVFSSNIRFFADCRHGRRFPPSNQSRKLKPARSLHALAAFGNSSNLLSKICNRNALPAGYAGCPAFLLIVRFYEIQVCLQGHFVLSPPIFPPYCKIWIWENAFGKGVSRDSR